MPKTYSYGETIQNRVKRLLEALLDYVNSEFEQNLRIEYKWEPEDSNNLNITTTLRELLALTGKDKYDAKLTKSQVDYALKHYLKEYLEILVDNRTITQGSDEWIFTLKLWERDKEANLRNFYKLWEEKRQGKSKELALKEQQEEDLWREIFRNKLENQLDFIRHKATERGFEINVHVPLGLVERKQQQRRDKLASPENPYDLQQEVIVKTYEHHAFLQEVIGLQSAENKKHIGIIGEAGAGKTTLLSKVAEFLKDETEYLPVWISLASLQEETLENYLLETWFSSIECSKNPEQLKQRFSQGDIWLLLDGVDEMAENSPLDAAASSLGLVTEIGIGNENAINALVDLIRNQDVDNRTKYSAASSLREILVDKYMPKVVTALTPYLSVETYNKNPIQFERCYEIIWKCAENMMYSEFYQAWHQQNNSTI
jgi:energy-coupling factor transporter ATP-binding protein EcfA2